MRFLRKRYRLALGRYRRVRHWEFWPVWAIYAPVLPSIVASMLRYRSVVIFSAANPGIPFGGLIGESKWDSYRRLGAPEEPLLPRMVMLPARQTRAQRVRDAMRLADVAGMPVVVKPDRGFGSRAVHIVRERSLLERLVAVADRDVLVQEYLPGEEYGVFWVRHPDAPDGELLSVARKEPLRVVGNGASDLETLILEDDRAVCQAARHLRVHRRRLRDVPSAGELVTLVELGCHHHGAVFRDAGHLDSPALRRVIGRLSDGFEGGFQLGRFDVRAADDDALSRGELRIIELNGVASEPLHIYDPAYSLREPVRALSRQWRLAFEIGAANRRNDGVELPSARTMLRRWRREQQAEGALDRRVAQERDRWEQRAAL